MKKNHLPNRIPHRLPPQLLRKSLPAVTLGALLLAPTAIARADSDALITGNGVNLRSSPTTASTSLGKLYRGSAVTVTGKSGDWYVVSSDGKRGYVYDDYVSVTTKDVAMDASATVTASALNLRSGPGADYSRIKMLYRGETVQITAKHGTWYAVSHGGKKGYVSGAYLKLIESTPDTDAPSVDTTPDDNTGSSVTESTNLKKGSRGSAVKALQSDLILLGYLNDSADGIFGSKTEAAVKKYQSKNKLTADGIAGKKTRGAISAEVDRINTVIRTAKSFLGTDYVYGGSTPETGFDCSGLTQWSYAAAGISIPRVSYEQARAGVSIPRSEIRVGDLVAFNSPVSHVGIYVGDGKFIHSPKTGDVVKITKLSAMNLTAIRRVTGVRVG